MSANLWLAGSLELLPEVEFRKTIIVVHPFR
jgi:hypothetical protein